MKDRREGGARGARSPLPQEALLFRQLQEERITFLPPPPIGPILTPGRPDSPWGGPGSRAGKSELTKMFVRWSILLVFQQIFSQGS